jgi:transposase
VVSSAEMERMMKVQEVILKAMAGSLKWWEATEIIGVSDRTMRRWRERYQDGGYDGLYDRRKRRPSPKRVALKTAENGAAVISGEILRFQTCGISTRS